jgi:molybdopterin-guanine dinucleotide biosynthesis protein A
MSPAREAALDGIVLAGGSSRRFGRDKLAEPFRGRPLLHHPVGALLALCPRVVVVLAPRGADPPIPDDARVEVARDAVADRGPLVGLRAGLERAVSELVLVVGGDMPDLRLIVLETMVRAGRETGATVVALSDASVARPLPLVVRARPARDAIERLLAADRRRLRDLLAEVETVMIDEPTWTALDPERRTLLDVDEPSDLDR